MLLLFLTAPILTASWGLAQTPPTPAPLDEATRARGVELHQNGEILYQEGSYEAAIAAWTEGWRLTHQPDFLWNIAAAQERLGDLQGALATLDQYRAFASAEEREAIERRIRNLEGRLSQQATVPAPTPVPAMPPPVPERPPRTGLSPGRKAAAWSLLGTGVAGLALGSVYGFRSLQATGEASDRCTTVRNELWCPSSADDPLAASRRRALVADVGFVLGGTASLGGVVLLLPF